MFNCSKSHLLTIQIITSVASFVGAQNQALALSEGTEITKEIKKKILAVSSRFRSSTLATPETLEEVTRNAAEFTCQSAGFAHALRWRLTKSRQTKVWSLAPGSHLFSQKVELWPAQPKPNHVKKTPLENAFAFQE